MEAKTWQIKLGIFLMVLSGVFFGVMLLIPFSTLENSQKIYLSSGSFIAMEGCFWIGGLLVGKVLFAKYKARLNPFKWVKRKK